MAGGWFIIVILTLLFWWVWKTWSVSLQEGNHWEIGSSHDLSVKQGDLIGCHRGYDWIKCACGWFFQLEHFELYIFVRERFRLRHQVNMKSADHAMPTMLQCLRHRCLGEGRSRRSRRSLKGEEKNLALLITDLWNSRVFWRWSPCPLVLLKQAICHRSSRQCLFLACSVSHTIRAETTEWMSLLQSK